MSKYLNSTSLYSAVNSGLSSSYSMLSYLYSDGLTLENLTSAMTNSTVLSSSYGTTFASYLMSNFTSIDKDNDGVLSSSDIQSFMNSISTQGLTRDQISTLGSSVGISSSLQETVLAHFDEIDTNNDGKVSSSEIQSYNVTCDIEKQKIEDINNAVNRMSLFTDDLTEYEGSIMDYKYTTSDEDNS